MTTKIAFLGLGAMGSRMAANLIDAGFDLTVWNRSKERTHPLVDHGATSAPTPHAAAREADIVFAMVRDDEASNSVWLDEATGAFGGMKKGALAIECSTLTVPHVRTLARAAKGLGLSFLDAPLAGSRPQAEAAQLIFLVGGCKADVESARPVLSVMGNAIHHAGDTGAGATVKLAVNALFGIQVAALAELIGMIVKNGVDPAKAVAILGEIPVASPAAKGAATAMLAGAFAPMFPVELVEKDFGYVEKVGGQMPMSAAARLVMQNAINEGFGDENLTGIIRLYDKN